ncbi:nuclear transport factor 2 family protein [Aquisediminimonas profunda]|uniref:nuclear transport factor 2 family protein n=1 Tax=Aquisediminimonas profunda TaxID=1550733 RepID=UPI001C62EFAB|nr:nuclear transport factor 2 family protein [Aquisediminimonas profunda]
MLNNAATTPGDGEGYTQMNVRFPTFRIDAAQVADMMAIQNVQAAYMMCLGAGAFEQILELFDLADPDVSISYGGNPPRVGPDAVRAEWAEFTNVFRSNGHVLGAHALTTPMIAIDTDGQHAQGSWMTWGFTFMGKGFGLDERRAMPSLSTYRNRFRKNDGIWKLSRVEWEIVATMDQVGLDPNWGWVRAPEAAPFPYLLSQ